MPRSKSHPHLHLRIGDDDHDEVDEEGEEDDHITAQVGVPLSPGTSPTTVRRLQSTRTSDLDLHSRLPQRGSNVQVNERSSLLASSDSLNRSYSSLIAEGIEIPRARLWRTRSSPDNARRFMNHDRSGSFGQRLVSALTSDGRFKFGDGNTDESKSSFYNDNRVWYDQFTSTDWVHDSIADAYRVKALRGRKDIRGKIIAWFDGAQGWLLVAIIGCVTALIAYFVDVTESALFDLKEGHCEGNWYYSRKKCCFGAERCKEWKSWSRSIDTTAFDRAWIDYASYVMLMILMAAASASLTIMSKTVVPSAVQLSTLDENLGAAIRSNVVDVKRGLDRTQDYSSLHDAPAMVYYSAAGSGVAEVKVILSGFVIHGYLGVKTLVIKTLALILSVASGLSIGKEGPFVHIATCVGNIACRLFSKYNSNDGKRREVLSASAASGVAVAFGAPIGGVLFSLEEVSYYFPPKTLFRTFFCCIAAALSLKFLNPYGTNKIVIFEVRYLSDWNFFEMIAFIFLGILGGAAGALFIKASRFWARTFRSIPLIKKWPMAEVLLVALVTGVISFWNRYTKLPVTELLFELASPCDQNDTVAADLCPRKERIPHVIHNLLIAFCIKSFLTIITFGVKVPAGIYVPSMVVGGLLGRIVGHSVQYLAMTYPHASIFSDCPATPGTESCVVPGVYAMVAAGATMCGVTRLSVTLAVILFELTGSLDHVLPFSLAILVSKWTADAIEPLSIYDLLTEMNSYPFLDNKVRPIFTTELADITPRFREERVIDVSNSPLVPAVDLRTKLDQLHKAGELDGGLPILRNNILVGLIPAPDLEFALDKLDNQDRSLCLMAAGIGWSGSDGEEEHEPDPTDFTPYIDPVRSP
ncbi:MAG: hypothetical protein M1825_002069 [Sarcosagium campestre]|nr:MAG: hypothetical protein M1825_002069 [Sarcosagium campestre]